jgi:hypothetical protein
VGKVYNLCRVKTDISAVLPVKSGLDPHMIIELEDDLNRHSYVVDVHSLLLFKGVGIYLHLVKLA